ncbi:Uncharacterized protein Adt_23317 [Abeliophyllum distichum]|uniref:Transposase n=1 Tax=Abeliophyllum distichum TaxID=126358 RepID=A0ABD1SDI6_9LAMI
MASRTRPGKKKRVVATFFELTAEVPSSKRKGSGPTRGKGTDDIVTAAGKISLDISKKSGRAIGNQQARLASECGYIVRSFAPLRYKRWIDIPKEEKNTLYDRVLEKFKLDLTIEHVLKCANDALARQYRDYQCRLKKKYFNKKLLDDAMKNHPIDVKQVDWDWLCEYWSTPDFQETMLDIKEQPVLEGSQAPTKFEIMQEVLGKCRGYIRGIGHGPKPASSHSVDLKSPDIESIALREQIEK